jgi:hypothetical protein
MKAVFSLLLLLLLFACSAPKKQSSVQEEKCLNYGPREKVQLEGQLYQKSFPGPPNYTDIKEGDKEEKFWLIKTPKGFCVNDKGDAWAGKLVNQTDVQLVIMPELINWYETKKSLLTQKVIVTGTLFPQMSGHHKTEVLINVESLEKANE